MLPRSLPSDIDLALRATLLDRPWWAGPRIVLLISPLAGLAIGSFGAVSPERAPQMLYAAIKLPLMILGSAVVCLPAFFVMHLALRARRDFPLAVRGVLGGQAVFAIALAGLAPLIPVWYGAVHSHRLAILANGALFAIASACSLVAVARAQRRSTGPRLTSRALLVCWLFLYTLVGMQTAWMLRPFIGSPEAPISFLRERPLTNGYVAVLRQIVGG